MNVICRIIFIKTSPSESALIRKKNEKFIHFCHERNYIPLPFHDGGILEKYEKMSEHIARIF